ncbi:MAG: hypothetical protein H7Y31_08785 [Chitinophagaceae bacterium]|nr:hypothetical protein [Chitinophagaceae bacterium]
MRMTVECGMRMTVVCGMRMTVVCGMRMTVVCGMRMRVECGMTGKKGMGAKEEQGQKKNRVKRGITGTRRPTIIKGMTSKVQIKVEKKMRRKRPLLLALFWLSGFATVIPAKAGMKIPASAGMTVKNSQVKNNKLRNAFTQLLFVALVFQL